MIRQIMLTKTTPSNLSGWQTATIPSEVVSSAQHEEPKANLSTLETIAPDGQLFPEADQPDTSDPAGQSQPGLTPSESEPPVPETSQPEPEADPDEVPAEEPQA